MAWSVTIGGQTFTQDNVEGNAYANEATGMPAILAAVAAEAELLKGYAATSTTAVVPALGSKSFTLDQSPLWSEGAAIMAVSAADPAKYMIGEITSLVGPAMTMNCTIKSGTVTASDWKISSVAAMAMQGSAVGDIDLNGFLLLSGKLGAALNANGNPVNNASNLIEQGEHIIPIPAAALRTRAGGSPATWGTEFFGTSGMQAEYWEFDYAANNVVQLEIPMPKSWDNGAINLRFLWYANSGTSYGVRIKANATARGDGGDLQKTPSAAVNTDDTGGTNDYLYISPWSPNLTPAASGSDPKEYLSMEIWRDTAASEDTLDAPMKLVGVQVKYSVNAATDA